MYKLYRLLYTLHILKYVTNVQMYSFCIRYNYYSMFYMIYTTVTVFYILSICCIMLFFYNIVVHSGKYFSLE